MGIDPERDKAVRDYELEQGRFFQKKDTMPCWRSGFARGLGVKVGDQVKLTTSRGVKPFTVVGLLSPHGVAGFKQGNVIFMPLRTAQLLVRQRRRSQHHQRRAGRGRRRKNRNRSDPLAIAAAAARRNGDEACAS